MFNTATAPIHITTPRLLLRPLEITDSTPVFNLLNNPQSTQYLTISKLTRNHQALSFILQTKYQRLLRRAYSWAITSHDTTFLGAIDFQPISAYIGEVGYILLPSAQHHGYAKEALTAILQWAASHPTLALIHAGTHPDNTPSKALLQKQGFSYLDTFAPHTHWPQLPPPHHRSSVLRYVKHLHRPQV